MRLVDRRRKTNCVNTRELRRTKHWGAVDVEYKRGTFRDYPGSFIGLSWVEPKKKEKSPAQDTTNLKQVYHFSETIHRGIDTASNSNQGSDFFRVGGFISGLWRREEGGIEGGGTGFIEKTCRYPPHSAVVHLIHSGLHLVQESNSMVHCTLLPPWLLCPASRQGCVAAHLRLPAQV